VRVAFVVAARDPERGQSEAEQARITDLDQFTTVRPIAWRCPVYARHDPNPSAQEYSISISPKCYTILKQFASETGIRSVRAAGAGAGIGVEIMQRHR